MNTITILDNRILNERVATVEVNTKELEIIQCRGKCNQVPSDYDKIVSAINNNMNKIREALLNR